LNNANRAVLIPGRVISNISRICGRRPRIIAKRTGKSGSSNVRICLKIGRNISRNGRNHIPELIPQDLPAGRGQGRDLRV
jgi:hypothetical protein